MAVTNGRTLKKKKPFRAASNIGNRKRQTYFEQPIDGLYKEGKYRGYI